MNKKFLFLFICFLCFQNFAFAEMSDFLADELKAKAKVKAPVVNLGYNYSDTTKIPIHLQITEKISTKDKTLKEGDKLLFKVVETSAYKGRPVVKKGDVIEGKIKIITKSGMNGIPYNIVIGDFEIPNIPYNKIRNEYSKDGFNRTGFVLPLKWALTFLPPTGSLTNFIFGGHCKITPKDKIILYYYPNWQ